jgi:glycosyltransferase XagB
MTLTRISIVVPTWNEEGNIKQLVESIDSHLSSHNIAYELIFIDDNSVDSTRDILGELSARYPISVYLKEGQRGKAQSLIQGFGYCKYPLIAMIDADLQYSPEYIPLMIRTLKNEDLDVVIADREDHETGLVRKVVSKSFSTIFVRWLHGLKVDAQSGLKVFRKEILESIHLSSEGWAFDLDFLVQSRKAGFKIGSIPIVFQSRNSGDTKVNLLHASWQIGTEALKLKLKRNRVTPFRGRELKEKGRGFNYKGADFVHHSDLHHHDIALERFGGRQIEFIVVAVLIYLALLILDWHSTLLVTFGLLTFLYFADLLFNLFLIIRSFNKNPEIKVSDIAVDEQVRVWPKYTVFCPLYKEWQVVPQFVTAMSKLDYPKDKLQVMLLLEEDDKETIAKVAEFDLPDYFDVVVVPHSMPKTKPKALNYGLTRAKGDYVVIYDAEDVPDPRQLKKAVLAFESQDEKTICIQAKLNFYNPHQNVLTRIFTAEYSLWFDLVLPGMQSISGPIPLGGTSNHFRTRDVAKLKGWDAFNVTEDCDLGIRLAKNGYKTAIIESTTLEEATSLFWNWYSQRSRWIKGYIQTYLVHMRRPKQFTDAGKHYHLFAFQFIVGGKILSMFINPLMWCVTVAYFAFRPILGEFIESFFPSMILYVGVFSFVAGNFLYLYYYMVACAKRGHYDLIKYVFFVPFYWLMMSFASWRAVYEMVVKPHYWAKTLHGVHLTHAKGFKQAKAIIGSEVMDSRVLVKEDN